MKDYTMQDIEGELGTNTIQRQSILKSEEEQVPTLEEKLIRKLDDRFTHIMKNVIERDNLRQQKIAYIREMLRDNQDVALGQRNALQIERTNRDYLLEEKELNECIQLGALSRA
jgi:lipid II:glycine glycyltransferase (peptidoglycan interpeptide bridge formation enzyme)